MKFPTRKESSLFIREVKKGTYDNMQDYILDTMFLKSTYDEVHTIWSCRKSDSEAEGKVEG